MRNQVNITVTSKVIYKCYEVKGFMPCSNSYRTIDVKIDYL